MKNTIIKGAFLIIVLFGSTLSLVVFFLREFKKSARIEIEGKRKMYGYQTYRGVVNPVLYIKKIRLKDSLVSYYDLWERGVENPTFNFPPLTLPYDTCVYVLNVSSDSTVTEFVCYGKWKRNNFIRGWVYTKHLHDQPPPDSLIKR